MVYMPKLDKPNLCNDELLISANQHIPDIERLSPHANYCLKQPYHMFCDDLLALMSVSYQSP
ncbi:MAG TPA: hypothetical protein PK525_13205, partial [Anaerohalosphaeraceae bacterium]|nr:hypothetical protein [Anaerohalosphaeraceae bacterium]